MSGDLHEPSSDPISGMPTSLEIKYRSSFWTIEFPRFAGPVVVLLLAVDLLGSLISYSSIPNPGSLVAMLVKAVFVVGIGVISWKAWTKAPVAGMEFADRFRFTDGRFTIALDWNQLLGLWYEGVRNPARVNVLDANPSRTEDRILIVGISGGREVRMQVPPEVQPEILEWARFIDGVRRST